MNLYKIKHLLIAAILFYIQLYCSQHQINFYPNLLLPLCCLTLLLATSWFVTANYIFFLELFLFIQTHTIGLTIILLLLGNIMLHIQEKLYIKVIAPCVLVTIFQLIYISMEYIKFNYFPHFYLIFLQLVVYNIMIISGYYIFSFFEQKSNIST